MADYDFQTLMQCPQCNKVYDDFDGLGVLYCEQCGYCKHASYSEGVCDYCNAPELAETKQLPLFKLPVRSHYNE